MSIFLPNCHEAIFKTNGYSGHTQVDPGFVHNDLKVNRVGHREPPARGFAYHIERPFERHEERPDWTLTQVFGSQGVAGGPIKFEKKVGIILSMLV